jgi:hypothetical protein
MKSFDEFTIVELQLRASMLSSLSEDDIESMNAEIKSAYDEYMSRQEVAELDNIEELDEASLIALEKFGETRLIALEKLHLMIELLSNIRQLQPQKQQESTENVVYQGETEKEEQKRESTQDVVFEKASDQRNQLEEEEAQLRELFAAIPLPSDVKKKAGPEESLKETLTQTKAAKPAEGAANILQASHYQPLPPMPSEIIAQEGAGRKLTPTPKEALPIRKVTIGSKENQRETVYSPVPTPTTAQTLESKLGIRPKVVGGVQSPSRYAPIPPPIGKSTQKAEDSKPAVYAAIPAARGTPAQNIAGTQPTPAMAIPVRKISAGAHRTPESSPPPSPSGSPLSSLESTPRTSPLSSPGTSPKSSPRLRFSREDIRIAAAGAVRQAEEENLQAITAAIAASPKKAEPLTKAGFTHQILTIHTEALKNLDSINKLIRNTPPVPSDVRIKALKEAVGKMELNQQAMGKIINNPDYKKLDSPAVIINGKKTEAVYLASTLANTVTQAKLTIKELETKPSSAPVNKS